MVRKVKMVSSHVNEWRFEDEKNLGEGMRERRQVIRKDVDKVMWG